MLWWMANAQIPTQTPGSIAKTPNLDSSIKPKLNDGDRV